MNEPKFIKAEFLGSGSGHPMLYFWECTMCGKSYTTRIAKIPNGLCKDCQEKEWQRNTEERKKKAEKKLYKKLLNTMKKSNFLSLDISSITLNGDKYYKAKDIEEAYKTLVDKCIEEENEKGEEV